MHSEVKGVLIFGGILLIVLAGFYISYISLKDQLPEEEKSFGNFVGKAMKQFGKDATELYSQRNKAVPKQGELETRTRLKTDVPEGTLSPAESACFKQGCYDSDGNDPTKKGRAFLRVPASLSDIKEKKINLKWLTPEQIKGAQKAEKAAYYKCVPADDYCKDETKKIDTLMVEQTCGFGPGGVPAIKPVLANCPCGCSSGVCLPCQPIINPDLVVKSIAKTALSEQCLNSFTFTICNEGDADVNKEFPLTVEANNIKKEYLVKQNKFPELKAGGCANIVVPGLFSVGGFGLDLNQNAEVKIVLDTTNVIEEKNENNNELKETVFTGDAYYYDPEQKIKCDTYCYETDAGKDYPNKGIMTFKYSGYVNNEEDFCPDLDINKVFLNERFCQLPIVLKSNGKFSNPASGGTYNCLDQIPPKKCSSGQCAPLTTLCEDAYGNLAPCLQCLDYEGVTTDFSQFQSFDQSFVDLNVDPLVKGSIDYTNIDNEKSKIPDECESTEVLKDFYCTMYDQFPLVERYFTNCYQLKTKAGVGHACMLGKCVALSGLEFKDGQMCLSEGASNAPGNAGGKKSEEVCQPIPPVLNNDLHNEDSPEGKKQLCSGGKCVPLEKGFEQCIGPAEDQTDPFKRDTVTEIKLLGETNPSEDQCEDYGDSVREYYCNGNFLESKKTSCDAILDKKGQGASCVGGECVFFDESLMSCKEKEDSGIDLEKGGYVDYVTGYGFSDSKGDECLNEDTLIETYCGGKDNKEITIYEHSCKEEGKICSQNACKTLKPELMLCSDTEQVNGKSVLDKNVYGEVSGVDTLGEGYFAHDKCGQFNFETETASSKVIERYCENKQLKETELTCDSGTLCDNGKCAFASESLKSCKVDEKNPFLAHATDVFGKIKVAESNCPPWNSKLIDLPYCQGNTIKYEHKSCPDGEECKLGGGEEGKYAICVKVDYSKEKCEEKETGAVKTDKFGETQTWNAYCFENGNIQKIVCISKTTWEGVELPCEEGKACNPQKDKCDVIDESKKNCAYNSANKQVDFTDHFGNSYSQEPFCNGDFARSEPYCDGKDKKVKDVPCAAGEECNFKNSKCQKVDYSKVSCTGPVQPNFNKKEKVIAYNKFGEQVMTKDGHFEDICIKDVELGEPANQIAEFWCEGNELEIDVFECPSGKTCKGGVCV